MNASRTINQILLCAGGIILVLLLQKYTSWDIDLQNNFFDPNTHTWIINEEVHGNWSLLFYKGIKILCAAAGISCAILLLLSISKPAVIPLRKSLFILLCSIIFVPLSISGGKALTNICTPKQMDIYGGVYPCTAILDAYPETFIQHKRASGFPAGHSSAGFCFMALYFCFSSRRGKWLGLAAGLALGWIAGTYQILRGEHFLSHTIVSMLWAWIMILIISFIANQKYHLSQK